MFTDEANKLAVLTKYGRLPLATFNGTRLSADETYPLPQRAAVNAALQRAPATSLGRYGKRPYKRTHTSETCAATDI